VSDEFTVYRSWSEADVRIAWDEFKRQMYDGAGPDELQAGIRCFDFLTRRSDLPEQLTSMIAYTIDEAETRMSLMRLQDNQLSHDEALEKLRGALKHLKRTCENLMERAHQMDPYTVIEHVRKMVARNHQANGQT
jgi:hypothetical protein